MAHKLAELKEDLAKRRQRERSEDELATTQLRRSGLPVRVLVDRVGPRWWARPGGVDQQVANVAHALAARRTVIEAFRRRRRTKWQGSGASTPGVHESNDRGWIMVGDDDNEMLVVARHLQDEIMTKIDKEWRQTEDGKVFVTKAWDKVNAEAQNKAERAKRRGAVGASTPGEGTDAQFEKAMKSYFRTHCDHAYGGQTWLKFLVTLGDVPEEVVDAWNNFTILRTQEKRGSDADVHSKFPDVTPGNVYAGRSVRAETPVPESFVKAKTHRENAFHRLKALVEWRELGNNVNQGTMDHARRMAQEATEASKQSGAKFKNYWGDWQNDFDSTRASLFEMVLEVYLLQVHRVDKEKLDTSTKKRVAIQALPPAGSASSSASTPAQGGKGDKGGDRGGGKGGGSDRGGGKFKGGGKGGGARRHFPGPYHRSW